MAASTLEQATTTSETLDLVLPDWAALDTVRRSPLPFALWTIGDQCLLHHWLDYAVNRGVTYVRIHAADRPEEVRRLVEESTLWPIRTETFSLASGAGIPENAILTDHLPGHPSPPPPQNGWDLLERAALLESLWVEQLHADPIGDLLHTGSNCRIHPTARLIAPYFIGDDVLIGPDCEVGPYAVIGKGSLIAGANHLLRSHVGPNSYLGPVTALEDCLLDNGIIFNLRNKARLDRMEAHLVSDLSAAPPATPVKERWAALRLYLASTGKRDNGFITFDGRRLPGDPQAGLAGRRALLPLVWKGKLPLFGIQPRTREQLEKLDEDWQQIIRHAPIGVFSYADCVGCHSPENPDEALHAVYQATLPPEILREAMAAFLKKLDPMDLNSRDNQP